MKKRLNYPVAAAYLFAALTVSFQNCTDGKNGRYLEGTVQPLHFDSKLADQTVYVGDAVAFSVVLRESASGVKYQWYKDGSKLAGVDGNKLNIEAAKMEDGGDYSVEILSDDFSPEIQSARLTVLERPVEPVAPEFAAQPQSKVLQVGERLVLEVSVTGHPQPGLQWHKDGRSLAHTAGQLIIEAVTEDDAGDYTVSAANKGGETLSETAKVTVQKGETFIVDNRDGCKYGYCRVSFYGSSPTPDPEKVEALCNARNYPYLADYAIRYGRYESHCNADGSRCYQNYDYDNVVATSITCTNNVNLRKLEVVCVGGKKPSSNGRCY